MFQFSGSTFIKLCIHSMITSFALVGFPHSEICGSTSICDYPQLIAACHVLLRLLMPRHSPYALLRLNLFPSSLVSFELLEFLLNIFSFGLLIILVKRFNPFAWIFFPPFGEIVIYPNLERPINSTSDLVKIICPLICSILLIFFNILLIRFSMNTSRNAFRFAMVGLDGLEPSTSRLSGARSSHLSYRPLFALGDQGSRHLGGDDGNRTHDPLLAGQVLSQLSYTPKGFIDFKDHSKSLWKLNNTCEVYPWKYLAFRRLVF